MPMTLRTESADKKNGMTLGELRAAIQETDRVGVDDAADVRVVIGWQGQLRTIEVSDR